MTPGFDPTEIIACAVRPAGSWSHLGSLVGFVVAAWFILPGRGLRLRRDPQGPVSLRPRSFPNSTNV